MATHSLNGQQIVPFVVSPPPCQDFKKTTDFLQPKELAPGPEKMATIMLFNQDKDAG
jgi:hypothetical protein